MDKICLDLHGAVCLQQTWRVGPGRFCPSIFEKTPWTKSAWIYTVLFAYNTWRGDPGRFCPSIFENGHGQDLPGSTRCCLLTKSMTRRSRQILSFDVLAKRPWTRSAWIQRCCLLTKSMARRSRQILSFDVLAKRPWTRPAWIYTVLFACKKHGA